MAGDFRAVHSIPQPGDGLACDMDGECRPTRSNIADLIRPQRSVASPNGLDHHYGTVISLRFDVEVPLWVCLHFH
ncbi:hypothetical protein D9611_002588 [Ephemerocybe angulata]|uniref:Uncharacterized protein n=1 Tax=Ephemerocybe angulata TaxID=980116 RepID=A0A8H5FDV0_9AGAR|nr:hypothetical protein D9611_002588 [Tulosesus angulatus]